jgi:hypothetical protein
MITGTAPACASACLRALTSFLCSLIWLANVCACFVSNTHVEAQLADEQYWRHHGPNMWYGTLPHGDSVVGCNSGFLEAARIHDPSFDDKIEFPLPQPAYNPTADDLFIRFSRLVQMYQRTIKTFCATHPGHEHLFTPQFGRYKNRFGDMVEEGDGSSMPDLSEQSELKDMFTEYYPSGVAWGPGGVGHWYLFSMLHQEKVLM